MIEVLDFYALPDTVPLPEFPDEDRFLGSVSMEQHRNLSLLFEAFGLEAMPPYYEDTRLTSSVVRLLLGPLKAKNWEEVQDSQMLTDSLDAFVSILEKADSQDNGVIAFCD